MSGSITALPGGLQGAGVICWWELSGRVDPETLAEALADEGLGHLKPPVTTPRSALQQAVGKLAGNKASKQHGVVALRRDKASWFLVEKHLLDGGADVSLAAFARVEADEAGVKSVVLRPGPSHIVDSIIAMAGSLVSTSASWSLSGWICVCHTKHMKAVSLRTAGGFYYVPPANRPLFDAFWRAVKVVSSHRVSTIDALPTDETVAAVGAALRREYATAIESLETDINEASTGMAKRSKRAKVAQCEALREKLAAYTGLLGASLNDLDEAVVNLGAALALVPEEV